MTSFHKSDFISRHTEELWQLFRQSAFPLDRVLADYYRTRKYLGAKDRRTLSEAVYTKIRALPWPEFLKPYYKASYDTPAPVTIRVNTLKIDRSGLQKKFLEEGISSIPTRYSPDGLVLDKRYPLQTLESFKCGYFEVQDEASQLVAYAAAPPADALVLDACAGAGGKALHLAAVMNNTGKIVTMDTDVRRLRELSKRASRAGVKNITIPRGERDIIFYDLVLIDAPCSSTGTIRRNPDLRLRVTKESITRYAAHQATLLDRYCEFVRPGGILLYATCSLLAGENEAVVYDFLERHPEFAIDPILPIITTSLPGLASVKALQIKEGFLRTNAIDHTWDGFFAARLVLTK